MKKTAKDNKKETKETIEQERNLLKITLEYLAQENETLKRQLEDMRITAKSNKDILREYVEKITNKDKVVEKMNNTIDQLQSRLQGMEDYMRNISSPVGMSGSRTNRPTTPLRTVLLSNPANKTQYKLSDNENTTGENVNYPEVPETRDNTGVYTTRNIKMKPLRSPGPTKRDVLKMHKYEAVNTKDFFLKQNKLFEELSHLKNELVTFLEKSENTKFKNHLGLDNITVSNESLCSSIENIHNTKKNKHINLKDNFTPQGDFHRLEKFLNDYSPEDRDILLFIDNNSNIWELIRRSDLTSNSLSSTQDIISLNKIIIDLDICNIRQNNSFEIDNMSFNNSDLELSRNTEMSVVNPIKETLNNISDFY